MTNSNLNKKYVINKTEINANIISFFNIKKFLC